MAPLTAPPPIQTTSPSPPSLPTATTATSTSPEDSGSSTITPGQAITTLSPFSPFPPTPDYDDVESPSLTSGNALARFEFERLDSKESRDCTKILMVEWEDDDSTRDIKGTWTVGWEGKKEAVVVGTEGQLLLHSHTSGGSVSVRQGEEANQASGNASVAPNPSSEKEKESLHRIYYLLPEHARVPGTVVLTLHGHRLTTSSQAYSEQVTITWRTHPLPAIYPPALGASARASGKKGVLHTIWAKKRLQLLKVEIEAEMARNPESISLEMAIKEREWIETRYGVKTKPSGLGLDIGAANSKAGNVGGGTGILGQGGLHSPASPRSPGRGPLFEKMKGLKLATTENDLKSTSSSGAFATTAASQEHNPLSPEVADVAVSWTTFASLNGLPDAAKDTLAAKPPQPPTAPSQQQQQPQQLKPIAPPQSILTQQQEQQNQTSHFSGGGGSSSGGGGAMASLDAFTSSPAPPPPPAPVPALALAQSSQPESTIRTMHFQSRTQSQDHPDFSNNSNSNSNSNNDDDDLFALPLSPRSPDHTDGDRGRKKFTFDREDTASYNTAKNDEHTLKVRDFV